MIAGWFFIGFIAGWYANQWFGAHEAAVLARYHIDRAEARTKATELECERRIKEVRDSYKLPWTDGRFDA